MINSSASRFSFPSVTFFLISKVTNINYKNLGQYVSPKERKERKNRRKGEREKEGSFKVKGRTHKIKEEKQGMIKYGEQGRQQRVNTNIKLFREQLRANTENTVTK